MQLIELWETYLFQLDAEDEAALLPAGVSVADDAAGQDDDDDEEASSALGQASDAVSSRMSEDTAAVETLAGSDEDAAHDEARAVGTDNGNHDDRDEA